VPFYKKGLSKLFCKVYLQWWMLGKQLSFHGRRRKTLCHNVRNDEEENRVRNAHFGAQKERRIKKTKKL
jgi:hypothetical protein